MAVFAYRALGAGGSVVTGELTASDRGEALRQLDRKGSQPVRVTCLLYTSPSPRDLSTSRMPSSA